jgi:hypothetical protein
MTSSSPATYIAARRENRRGAARSNSAVSPTVRPAAARISPNFHGQNIRSRSYCPPTSLQNVSQTSMASRNSSASSVRFRRMDIVGGLSVNKQSG